MGFGLVICLVALIVFSLFGNLASTNRPDSSAPDNDTLEKIARPQLVRRIDVLKSGEWKNNIAPEELPRADAWHYDLLGDPATFPVDYVEIENDGFVVYFRTDAKPKIDVLKDLVHTIGIRVKRDGKKWRATESIIEDSFDSKAKRPWARPLTN